MCVLMTGNLHLYKVLGLFLKKEYRGFWVESTQAEIFPNRGKECFVYEVKFWDNDTGKLHSVATGSSLKYNFMKTSVTGHDRWPLS